MALRRQEPRSSLATDPFLRKACPIVLRKGLEGGTEILAFEHPEAGVQLVKGTIEKGESGGEAALRELHEESGIRDARLVRSLGSIDVGPPGQVWQLFLIEAHDLADSWSFNTTDGGGREFRFFWHPIDEPPDGRWHRIFRQALAHIRTKVSQRRLHHASSFDRGQNERG